MMSRSHLIGYVATALLTAMPLAAHGQYNDLQRLRQFQQRQQQNAPREGLQVSGTLRGVRGPVLQVQTDEGEQWLVQLQPMRPMDVVFTGSAEASFLRPGLYVQFSTRLSKRGNAPEPIKDVLVTSVRDGSTPGVTAENAGGGGSADQLFGGGDESKKQPKSRTDENTVYRVTGQITKVSRLGEITVNAAGTSVKADVDDEARISVDVNDLSFARPGDKIEVRGWYYAGAKGQGAANQVTVSGAQPLSGAKKKSAAAAKGDDEDKPAAEKESKTAEELRKALEG